MDCNKLRAIYNYIFFLFLPLIKCYTSRFDKTVFALCVHTRAPYGYQVERQACARARHRMQPSTGGSKAGSTSTYNCDAADSPPAGGFVPATESEGWWVAAAPVARFYSQRCARGSNGTAVVMEREKGECKEAAAGRLHAPTPTTIASVWHPSHSYGLLACLPACLLACLLAYSLAPLISCLTVYQRIRRGLLGALAPRLLPISCPLVHHA